MTQPAPKRLSFPVTDVPVNAGRAKNASLRTRLHRWIHVLRFLVVGGVNTLFGYCLFAFLIWIRLLPEIALALSTVIGVMFNFVSYGKLVYNHLNRNSVPRYVALYVIYYGINALLLRLFLDTLHLSVYLTQMMLIPFMALGMFFALPYFVFRRRD